MRRKMSTIWRYTPPPLTFSFIAPFLFLWNYWYVNKEVRKWGGKKKRAWGEYRRQRKSKAENKWSLRVENVRENTERFGNIGGRGEERKQKSTAPSAQPLICFSISPPSSGWSDVAAACSQTHPLPLHTPSSLPLHQNAKRHCCYSFHPPALLTAAPVVWFWENLYLCRRMDLVTQPAGLQ